MNRKTYRQQEWFILGTLTCMGSDRFGGRIGDCAHEARRCLLETGELEGDQAERHLMQAFGWLLRLSGEIEMTLLGAGCDLWSMEDQSYLEIDGMRLQPLELGMDTMAEFVAHIQKEYARFAEWLSSPDMAVALNGLLVLTERTIRVVKREQKLLAEEAEDARHRAMNPEAADAPKCPVCGAPMRLRTAKSGVNAGSRFWGCTQYPACRGVREIIGENS